MTEMVSKGREDFPVGSWECPDPDGIIRRGEAVYFRRRVEMYEEPPDCFVGWSARDPMRAAGRDGGLRNADV